MKTKYNRSTKSMQAVQSDVTLTRCCEKNCGITITIEKSDVSRYTRCIPCIMKLKLINKY